MFTGLIERTGRLLSVARSSGGTVMTVTHDEWDAPLAIGESVAVQGVCVTVTQRAKGQFTCNLLDETLSRTNLGRQRPGAILNLERALRVGDRLGGHMLSGHIDGAGCLVERRTEGQDWVLEIECEPGLLAGMVPKGSVACNGVSLTIASLGSRSFSVRLIPFTWNATSLPSLREGDPVNLELDMIGKFVRRYLEQSRAATDGTDDDIRALIRAGLV